MAIQKVKARWVIELPADSKIKVKKGEEVDRGGVVAVSESVNKTKADWSGWFGQLNNEQKEALRGLLRGRKIESGERIDLSEVKIMGVKSIVSESQGIVETIDEFGNLVVINEQSQTKVEIRTPVKAKVDLVGEDKMEMVFAAYKLVGQGLTSGRVWGLMDKFCWLNKITELNSKLEGKILAVERLDDLWLIKAGVVGVGAIMTQEWVTEEEDAVEMDIPIIKLGKKEWIWLYQTAEKEVNVLVNSEMNRALVVKS